MTNALANKQGQLAPLKNVEPKDVLERVLNEESTKDIAKSLGVTRSALNQWLLSTAETDWKAAQVIRAHKRKDEAEDEIETAADPLSLARAREKLRAAQWDLERVCRRIYGQDAPTTAQAVQINISLRGEPLQVVGEQSKE
jgi:transposase